MGATTFSLSDVNHKILQSAVTNKPITYCFQLYQYSPHSHLLLRDPALLEHMFDPAAVPSASFLEVIRVFQWYSVLLLWLFEIMEGWKQYLKSEIILLRIRRYISQVFKIKEFVLYVLINGKLYSPIECIGLFLKRWYDPQLRLLFIMMAKIYVNWTYICKKTDDVKTFEKSDFFERKTIYLIFYIIWNKCYSDSCPWSASLFGDFEAKWRSKEKKLSQEIDKTRCSNEYNEWNRVEVLSVQHVLHKNVLITNNDNLSCFNRATIDSNWFSY